jgi:GNAT superfamily N-acetyltransferase
MRPMPEIREFSSADASGVVSVILPIQQNEFGIPVTLEAQPDLADITGFYRRGRGNFWVAVSQGRIVGTIGLLDIGNNQAVLRKMFVIREFRGSGHGVAQKLLDTLLAWSASREIAEIFLGTTTKFLAAHRFYEKNRFLETPKSDLPSDFPIMAVDSKFYRRRVTQASPE